MQPQNTTRIPAPDGIQLWLIDLRAEPSSGAWECLSPQETVRADAFVRPADRRRFISSHAALRALLAPMVGLEPQHLQFDIGRYGKPMLQRPAGPWFNLSHSADWALLAVSRTCEVGVDIEVWTPMIDADDLARAHFTASERAAMSRAPAAERDATFLGIWTRKEACMKAVGMGLNLQPAAIDVAPVPALTTVGLDCDGVLRTLAVSSVELPVEAMAAVAWLIG